MRKCFFLYLLLVPLFAYSQLDTNRLMVGGLLGYSRVTYNFQNVPVNPFFSNSAETGFSLVIPVSNFNIKSGLGVTFFRSPLVENNLFYEEFLRLPVLINVAGNIQKRKISFFIGPEFSLLLRQGVASINDSFYNFPSETFGNYMKIGISSDISYNIRDNRNNLHLFGVKFYQDIPSFIVENRSGVTILDRYITGTIYYSFFLYSLKIRN